MPRQLVTSRENRFVRRLLEVRRQTVKERAVAVAEGVRLVEDVVASGLWPEALFFCSELGGWERAAPMVARLDGGGVPCLPLGADLFRSLSSTRTPQAVMALVPVAWASPDAVCQPDPALVVLPAEVQDPGNLGAVVRVADAAGATGVVVAAGTADPFGDKALRGSAGSAFHLPVSRLPTWAAAHKELWTRGLRQLVATPAGGRSYLEVDFREPVALWLGNEGAGVRVPVGDGLEPVSIPMSVRTESLNVAAAAAVLLFEARRQRLVG